MRCQIQPITMKTPIKDKTRALKSTAVLKQIIPRGSTIDSYLFYSGEQEINLCLSGRKLNAHTNKAVVYNFWSKALEDSRRLAEMVTSMAETYSKFQFVRLQEQWVEQKDPWISAALFFILNRCSDTGMVSSGVLDSSDYEPFSLFYLINFDKIQNFSISYCPWEETTSLIQDDTGCDYIFIPCSNFSRNLFEYGKNRGVEQSIVIHRELKNKLREIDKKWIISYNYHNDLVSFYNQEHPIMIDKHGLITKSEDKCVEILFSNFVF